MKWNLLYKGKKINSLENIQKIIFENRGIKTKKEIDEYLNPKNEDQISWEDIGIKKDSIKDSIKRIEKAKAKKEKIIIFGDYDCDGVCSTAILWETLYKNGYDVLPYIPDRFSEGYGLKKESIKKLEDKFGKINLIITVDNGIVANDGINEALKNKIDVIVVDHHRKEEKKLKTPYIIHSTEVCGSTLSWLLSGEIDNKSKNSILELACIGTVADQMPLTKINRSIVKFGLEKLNKTKRIGLKEIIKISGITKIGTYEIGFMIAPRINAAGRLNHAIDALRLVCTTDKNKANILANNLNDTNLERQKVVENVLKEVLNRKTEDNLIVLEGQYHEGVIGLASGRITEKTYKPSIIISKGEKISKASARSIEGFNIIEVIKETGLIFEGGGHPMAAGFTIETEKINEFKIRINQISQKYLNDEILEKKLKIDLEIDFENINNDLIQFLKKMEPIGYGNFAPVFLSKDVEVVDKKTVGSEAKHLKLKLKQKDKTFDAIWFNANSNLLFSNPVKADIAFTVEENIWNGRTSKQINVKDIALNQDLTT